MECFLPALSSLRGTNPAHEHRLPAEGNLFISTPISEMILKAVNLLACSSVMLPSIDSLISSKSTYEVRAVESQSVKVNKIIGVVLSSRPTDKVLEIQA